jgi:hypothetical protein
MQWSVLKNFHGCGTPPTYDVISTRSLSTISKGLSSETHAHLIAAAPDLLEALLSILEHSREFSGLEDHETMVSRIEDKARAAIRKAEGVAP